MYFWDLFEYVEDYPNNLVERGIPQNTLFNYISESFLQAYINSLAPFYMIMIERYQQMTEENNQEILDYLNNQKFHTDYRHEKMDDILILAESENSFWFLWFDHDVSDCSMGRISKSKIGMREMKKCLIDLVTSKDFDFTETGKEASNIRYLELPLPNGYVKF